MKRNKHHGLNVEFDGLCMDFGHVSLNKKKEFLCGDCYKIEENDEDHVLVLSDGLGSGVKANILSTLTATMLSTMIINQVELDEAVRAVAKTLPVCSVRNLAYATFTVLNFQGKQVSLYQFDNPDAILIRDGRLFDYPVETSMIEEKEIHKSCFELKDEDMLIVMSDGVTNAGMGKTTNGGWGRDDVMAFCRAKYHKGMSAQEMAGYLAEASLDLNLNETDDDITAIVLRMRHKQVVNLMIGPPSKEEHDERYLKSFFDSEGYHVICGGTTAQCAARYLDKELISLSETACGDVPAYYKLEGTELVTEGFLTIEHLLEYCEEWMEDRLSFNRVKRKKDAAALLGVMLFEQATDINFYFGGAINKSNVELGITEKRNSASDKKAEGDDGTSKNDTDGDASTNSSQAKNSPSDEVVEASAVPSSSTNGSDGVYVVEKGDTLAIISKKMYGDVTHVDAICRMNGLSNGNLIYIGQKLILP